MAGIDEGGTLRPVAIAVLTVSDSRDLQSDTSGQLLVERAETGGHILVDRALVKDEQGLIEAHLRQWIARPDIEVILLTGGTGITRRDVTPEAVHAVMDKHIPGFGELFRALSYEKIGTSTIQSRATAAVAGGTLIFALPASTGASADAWDLILSNQLDSRYRPCNFVQMLPRLGPSN